MRKRDIRKKNKYRKEIYIKKGYIQKEEILWSEDIWKFSMLCEKNTPIPGEHLYTSAASQKDD